MPTRINCLAMFRRAFVRALSMSAAAALPVTQPGGARPMPQPDPPRNTRPISLDNPRIRPATPRSQPLAMRVAMRAVEAFAAPGRADEMGVHWQRIMFDCSALQARGADDWSFVDDWLSRARAERVAG